MYTVKHLLSKTKNIKLLPAFIIFLAGLFAVVTVVLSTRPVPSLAETGIPFGGLSVFIKYCTCNTNPGDIAVTVNDLSTTPGSPPNYVYSPGYTILHPFGMIYSTGVWLLGNRQQPSSCRYWVGKSCWVWPTSGTMVRVGTSG